MPSAEVATLAKLKAQGWHLSEEGLELCREEFQETGRCKRDDGRAPSVDEIISVAKNMDLKAIGNAFLADFVKPKAPAEQDSAKGAGPTSVVLQIQKMRNVSAPKINENSNTAPRMLRVNLTDGFTTILGLEIENVPSLNLDLPPGTKVRVKLPPRSNVHVNPSVPGGFVNNYLLLGPGVLSVLGGRVSDLAEKWELMKSVTGQNRLQIMAGDSEGPPPWVEFDKNSASNAANKSFKAPGGTSRPSGDGNAIPSGTPAVNQEFENQRRANIAEAAAKGSKKPFEGGAARQGADMDKREDPRVGPKKGPVSPTALKPEPAINGTNGAKVAGSDIQNAVPSKSSQQKRDGPQDQGKPTSQGPDTKKPQGGSPPAPSPTGGSTGGGENREPRGRISPEAYPGPYGRQRGPHPDSRRGGRGGPSGSLGLPPGGSMGWGNPRPFANPPTNNFNPQPPHFSGSRVVTNSNVRRGGMSGSGPGGPGYATGPPGGGHGRGRYYQEEDESGDPRRRGPVSNLPGSGHPGGRPGGPPPGMNTPSGGPGYHQQWDPNKGPQRFSQGEPQGNHGPGLEHQKQDKPENRGVPMKKPGEGPPVQVPPLLPHPSTAPKPPLIGHEPPRDFGGPGPKLHPNHFQSPHHGMPQQFSHPHGPHQGQHQPAQQHQGPLLPKPNIGNVHPGGPGQQPQQIPHAGPPNGPKPSSAPGQPPLQQQPPLQGPGPESRPSSENMTGPGRSPRPSPDHVGQPVPNQGRAGTPGSGPPSLSMQPSMASFQPGQPPHGMQHPQMPVQQQQQPGPLQHPPHAHQTPPLMGPHQQQTNHYQGGIPGGYRPNGPPLVASPGLQQQVPPQMHPAAAAAAAASLAQQHANVNALQQQFQQMGLVRGSGDQSPGPPMNHFGGGPPPQPPTPQQLLHQQHQQHQQQQQQQQHQQQQHQHQRLFPQQPPHHMQTKLSAAMPTPPGFQASHVSQQGHQQHAAGIPFFAPIPGFVPQGQHQNAGAAPPTFPIHPSLLQTQQIQQIINAMAVAGAAMRPPLKIGDIVMARYWEDKEFYRAQIVDFTDRGYKVHFFDYGNTEEVGLTDIYASVAPTMAPVADPSAMAAAMAAALSAQSPPPTAPSPYRYY